MNWKLEIWNVIRYNKIFLIKVCKRFLHRYLSNARVAFLINTPLKHRLWLRRYEIYGFWKSD